MLDGSLSRLSKHPWATVSEVGDQSPYVADMARVLRIVMPRVRAKLGAEGSSFRNFCDKFARGLMGRYQSAIFRCKRIGDMGAQQLLLDAQAIRSLLLAAPGMRGSASAESGGGGSAGGGEEDDMDGAGGAHEGGGAEPPAPPPAVYAKYVQREMPRVEMLLKIIASPKERFGDTIKALWPEASAADLTRVMELKGMSPKERSEILVALGLAKASAPILPIAASLGLGGGGGGGSSGGGGGGGAAAAAGGGSAISGVSVGSFAGASAPGLGAGAGAGDAAPRSKLGANIASSMKDMGAKMALGGKLFKKKEAPS